MIMIILLVYYYVKTQRPGLFAKRNQVMLSDFFVVDNLYLFPPRLIACQNSQKSVQRECTDQIHRNADFCQKFDKST
jgi:hypothetical protein